MMRKDNYLTFNDADCAMRCVRAILEDYDHDDDRNHWIVAVSREEGLWRLDFLWGDWGGDMPIAFEYWSDIEDEYMRVDDNAEEENEE